MELSTVPSYLPQSFSPHPQEGYYRVEFSQQSPLYLSCEAVEKIAGLTINSDQSCACADCSPALFAALFGMAWENKQIKEVLSSEQQQDPRIFEILHKSLAWFYPAQCAAISQSLLRQLTQTS